MVVVRRPARWRGCIHSEKWNTSSRPASHSTGGWPARVHSVRHVLRRRRHDDEPALHVEAVECAARPRAAAEAR